MLFPLGRWPPGAWNDGTIRKMWLCPVVPNDCAVCPFLCIPLSQAVCYAPQSLPLPVNLNTVDLFFKKWNSWSLPIITKATFLGVGTEILSIFNTTKQNKVMQNIWWVDRLGSNDLDWYLNGWDFSGSSFLLWASLLWYRNEKIPLAILHNFKPLFLLLFEWTTGTILTSYVGSNCRILSWKNN